MSKTPYFDRGKYVCKLAVTQTSGCNLEGEQVESAGIDWQIPGRTSFLPTYGAGLIIIEQSPSHRHSTYRRISPSPTQGHIFLNYASLSTGGEGCKPEED